MHSVSIVDPAVLRLAPDFRAVHLLVTAPKGSVLCGAAETLEEAYRFVRDGSPSWADAHLPAWAEVYARFSAKPNRTPCSAKALRKRVLKDGALPSISPVVDLYNAISLRFAVPVGGENLDAYVGAPRLTIADGSGAFDTAANGEPAIEHPLPGEVVWRDDLGVTCRHWNWRQGSRTRLHGGEKSIWFVLEALGAMPRDALDEAAGAFSDRPRSVLPDAQVTLRNEQ